MPALAAPPPAAADAVPHAAPDGPRLATFEPPEPAAGPVTGPAAKPLSRRIAAVRRLHGVRRRATWRQRIVEAERGLVLGFRRDGVLAGHLFVLTLAVAAGVVFELNTARWCVIFLALAFAMAAELFGQVVSALAAAMVRDRGPSPASAHADADAEAERVEQITGAVRLCSAAVAVASLGAAATLAAVFTPAVVKALGG